MAEFGDFTFVVQGPLTPGEDPRSKAQELRDVFPGCAVVLASFEPSSGFEPNRPPPQRSAMQAKAYLLELLAPAFDAVALIEQPAALPQLKIDSGQNNINRQIASTAAGLAKVKTRYAVKLRSDALLVSPALLQRFLEFSVAGDRPLAVGQGRILIPSFFTLNPRIDERMLYHLSDWVQVGFTEDLRTYWSAPPFRLDDAVHYLTHDYAAGSTGSERRFLARYAVEQWLAIHYARRVMEVRLDFHNDWSPERLARFEDFMVDNFVVFRPENIGLVLPKYAHVSRSVSAELKCYNHNDWAALARKRGVNSPYRDRERAVASHALQHAYMALRPLIRRIPGAVGLMRMGGREL
ncbi:WavE lipopolysaccharide synthesis family protein [Roseomonas sp. BN140053]|uniref:WavE lipopolysaccharide synthesis family protein n=1 Tax=Roseomonas sp. BN140053 TaxID=3391898 RepID=UPI0039EADDB6